MVAPAVRATLVKEAEVPARFDPTASGATDIRGPVLIPVRADSGPEQWLPEMCETQNQGPVW
jgi:hypothetical protein